ncbi:MAG: metallophosphoesterase family protein [bacterium]
MSRLSFMATLSVLLLALGPDPARAAPAAAKPAAARPAAPKPARPAAPKPAVPVAPAAARPAAPKPAAPVAPAAARPATPKPAAPVAPAAARPAAPAPAPPQPLALGPVVQHVTQTSVTIFWATKVAVNSTLIVTPYGKSGPVKKKTQKGAPLHWHRLTLTGLTPATLYHYEVRDGRGRTHDGSFRTAVGSNQPFTFLVYGDCRTMRDRHLSVVESMLEESAAFAVNTGDLVEDGVKHRLWHRFFRIERPLLRRMPVYPVLGNHELKSSWHRGVAAFRRYFRPPQNGPDKGVVYSFVYGNSLFLVLNSNASFVGTEQTSWATAQLKAAASNPDIRHTFVFLHHGPYASGIHGENDDAQISGLAGAMSAHGVDAVFAGHDHIYERGENDGLRYVISGGCGAPLYPRRKINPYTAWFESATHYVRVAVNGDEVELTALHPGGTIIDHLKFAKRRDAVGKPTRFVTLVDSHPRPMIKDLPRPPDKARRPPARAVKWGLLVGAGALVLLGLLALLVGGRIRR